MHVRRRSAALLAGGALALSPLTVLVPATAVPSSDPLAAIVADDDSARLDEDGRLYYVEPIPDPPPAGTQQLGPQQARVGAEAASVALPELHSRSTSTHVIYLDFDGVTLPATSAWAAGPNPIPGNTTYTGFTLDADPDFSQAEVDYIIRVWKFVAEKYAPFDIDVTTVDPGPGGYTRTGASSAAVAADQTYGSHVVFTDDSRPVNAICGGQCAGVGYLDVFDGRFEGGIYPTTDYAPTWVFTSMTFDSSQISALAAAHEVGHNLGLNHDGVTTVAGDNYYAGHANWTPIMGNANQRAVSQFSKGDYANANNQENDLAIIGANGNSGAADSLLLPDDHPTTGSAPEELGNHQTYAVDGVIGTAADDDLFSIFRTCTSQLTATVSGIGAGQAVDLKVEILNASDGVLAAHDPASGQVFDNALVANKPAGMDATASIATTTSGSTYRIRVSGVGSANPLNTGYNDYGSIGAYHLEISGCPPSSITEPGAPATATASPISRTTTGTVSWTAGTNGGSPITGYRITGLPLGDVNLGNVLTHTATGLTPGVTYDVTVFAKNAVGTSLTGTSTTLEVDTFAPTTKPGLTATQSGSTATLDWTAPANPGGATLTGWRVLGTGATTIDDTVAAGTLTKDYAVNYGTTSFTVQGVYTATDTGGAVPSDSKSVQRATTTPGAPATATATPAVEGFTASINWTAPTSNGGSTITKYQITGLPVGTVQVGNVLAYAASGLIPGTTYDVTIAAGNANGFGPSQATSVRIATWAPTTRPTLTVTRSGQTATLTYVAPDNPGKATLTGWFVDRTGPGTAPADKTVTTTSTTMTGLAVGTQTFTVRPVYTADSTVGVQASLPTSVLFTTKPSAPRIGTAVSGKAGGTRSATAKWAAPLSTGGTSIRSYKVVAYKVVKGKVAKTYTSKALAPSARSYAFPLPAGSYKFRVVAYNVVGRSPFSAYSKVVVSR